MPKINWSGADEDELLTAEDIEGAEEGYQTYAGDLPPGGVYRFKIQRAKYTEFQSRNQGLNIRMELDGSWKREHAKYDGAPLWDRVVMTRAAASFVKAFAAAIGVSAADMINKVIVDEDGYVTKIGRVSLEGKTVYVAVKRGSYNEEPRLEIAGTGYQVVEVDDSDAEEEAPARRPAKAAAGAKAASNGKPAKGKNKGKADDDEPPF